MHTSLDAKEYLVNTKRGLRVEYATRRSIYGIAFIVSLFCEYVNLEYVRMHVTYRVCQAEYGVSATGIREYLFNT